VNVNWWKCAVNEDDNAEVYILVLRFFMFFFSCFSRFSFLSI